MITDRIDGFLPIEGYGVLGNGRTVALVGSDGRIDWWPLPTMDAPPVFAALLDPPHGGHLTLQPEGEFTSTRRYVDRTNVLETTFTTDTGSVRVTDAIPVGLGGRLPWEELIRRIEGVDGYVDMHWAIVPGDRFRAVQPWLERHDETILIHVGDQHLALRFFDVGSPQLDPHHVHGRFRADSSTDAMIAVTNSDASPVFLPNREELDGHLRLTLDRWRDWSDSLQYDGQWSETVCRSALALKLLLYTPTGAIVAAPTTSLPERIGGDKNWDYRFMWLRDSSFTVDAFINLGMHEEVHAAVVWLLSTIQKTAPDLHVFYRLDGELPGSQDELPLPGYRDSQPVRDGNGAAAQAQLGTFGDLFDTVWRYVQHGHLLDPATGRLLAELADRCCDRWRHRDSGMWELGDHQHYTISKIGCWVALDRALQLHDRGQIATGHAERWVVERDAIRDWVEDRCWSEEKQVYTFYAGTEDLDAAVLLAGWTGFDRGDRLRSTIDAIRQELAEGPLVYRYTGMDKEEGAFLACSFWMVSALVAVGRTDDARAMMDELVRLPNDVGLLSEQMEPATRRQLGNFPQGLSHLALINAAVDVSGALRGDS
ncbi:MAG TPA: glycoside hydrolase family 15 protein [Mycobacteriales bacterium]|nr:glycoside hydrolase family 15 protein [Mycobacteriales bacterium]